MPNNSLASWLEHIAAVHPREIELGLDRVTRVAERLQCHRFSVPVITVAGTNGKGSCVAAMQKLLSAQGFAAVGTYTSPHLLHYNERIAINGVPCTDQQIVCALRKVEQARQEISLSYFEYSTLAALCVFQSEAKDAIILEVGLGGRLDAVNIVDADVAVITSIGLDHQDWLGDSLDEIGREKAGIVRANKPVVLASETMPRGVFDAIALAGATAHVYQRDFGSSGDAVELQGKVGAGTFSGQWNYFQSEDNKTISKLDRPALDISNVAAAIRALHLAGFQLDDWVLAKAMPQLKLPARFELRFDIATNTPIVFDVAHNPAAVENLCRKMRIFKQQQGAHSHLHLVIAMLSDKDYKTVCRILESMVDFWYISQVEDDRALAADILANTVHETSSESEIRVFAGLMDAYHCACAAVSAGSSDLVLVCGSFLGVSELIKLSKPKSERVLVA